MHTYDDKNINVRDSEDMLYTIENMACDDWKIVDNDGAAKELAK